MPLPEFGFQVQQAAGENHVGEVGGNLRSASHEYTRPANTTAYAAKDVIADSTASPVVMTFSNIARVAGGGGYITKARLLTDQKTNTARFRLHLYHTAPTAINDNDPMLLLYANKADRIGFIDFPACSTEDATNSTAANAFATPNVSGCNLPLEFTSSGGRNLYGILETLDAFTPASGQKVYVELSADCY